MSEHAWVLENVAVFVAGGLDAAEAERVEQHAASCEECAAALRQARALDDKLEALFAPERPDAALEDRLIRSLRAPRVGRRWGWREKVGASAAAAVLLTGTGAGMSVLIERGDLPFPGSPRAVGPQADRQSHLALDGTPAPQQGVRGFALGEGTWSRKGVPAGQDAAGFRSEARSSVTLDDNGAVADRPASPPPPPVDAFGVNSPAVAGGDGSALSLPGGATHLWSDTTFSAPETAARMLGAAAGMGAPAGAKPPSGPVGSFGGAVDGDKSNKDALEHGKKALGGFFRPDDVTTAFQEKPGSGKLDKEGKSGEQVPPPPPPAVTPPKPPASAPPEPAAPRKVIRSGDIEFEVESFDGAAATVTKLVAAVKGGYVATVNSDKLPNGKVRGSLVVRVPPEALDTLVLDLRKELGKAGELKGLRVGSQDVTKHYTDLESRLRAARTMETRLLEIIKSGKGEIKQLLEAEKELGVWRTKIEEFEGELRYLANQVGLSTLTITLAEKEIRVAAGLVESERVSAGIEVEDVEKARDEALKAVADAKGRVSRSELKQHAAGQFNAQLQFEVAPESAGPLRDRLRQLGTVVRFEIDRVQRAEGTGEAPRDGKVKKGDTQFIVSLYNLANVAPRETATLKVAAEDVPASYRALRDAVAKAKGRVLDSRLNEQDRKNVTAQVDFDVRRSEEGALQAALASAGELLSRNVTRAPEGNNVTDAKVLFHVELVNTANIPPRETMTVSVEVADVDATMTLLRAIVAEAKGRVIDTRVGQEPNGRVSGRAIYDVPLSVAPTVVERLKASGQVRVQQTVRNPNAPEGKLAVARLDVTLSNELLVPSDETLWAQVRKGLSYSLRGLSLSVAYLIFGLLVLLPWALLIGAVVWVARRLTRGAEATPVPVAVAPVAGGATATGA